MFQLHSPMARRYWPEEPGSVPGRLRILLTERRTAMVGMKMWFVGVAFVGVAAGAAAAGLLWMVFTRPVALAQFLSASL